MKGRIIRIHRIIPIPYPPPYPSDIRMTNIRILIRILRISKIAYRILKNGCGCGFSVEIIRTGYIPIYSTVKWRARPSLRSLKLSRRRGSGGAAGSS